MSKVLLELRNIVKEFPVSGNKHKKIQAVSNVSLKIHEKETLALVGESGCGKSTLGRCAIGLLKPEQGESLFREENIFEKNNLRRLRRQMQIVFQDPYASLNPRMNLGRIIGEPIITHEPGIKKDKLKKRVEALMGEVGIPKDYYFRYPHQFSGGQRQRVGIARAIALRPALLVCDEPVSALDVSIQSQVLNLLMDLQENLGMSYLFISHDLSVVHFIADRVCVMFLGKICEIGKTEEIFSSPLHPYTALLLEALPKPDPRLRSQEKKLLTGEIPSPLNPPTGCRFHTRCPKAQEVCSRKEPVLLGEGRQVACHFPNAGSGCIF